MSHHPSFLPHLSSHVFHLLSQRNIKTHFTLEEIHATDESGSEENDRSLILSSKCMVVLVSRGFQEDRGCMEGLNYARGLRPPKRLFPLFLEPDPLSWCSAEIVYLFQLRSADAVIHDVSGLAHHFTEESMEERDNVTNLPTDPSLEELFIVLHDTFSVGSN